MQANVTFRNAPWWQFAELVSADLGLWAEAVAIAGVKMQ